MKHILDTISAWPMPKRIHASHKRTVYAIEVADKALRSMSPPTIRQLNLTNHTDLATVSCSLDLAGRYTGDMADDTTTLIQFIKHG